MSLVHVRATKTENWPRLPCAAAASDLLVPGFVLPLSLNQIRSVPSVHAELPAEAADSISDKRSSGRGSSAVPPRLVLMENFGIIAVPCRG